MGRSWHRGKPEPSIPGGGRTGEYLGIWATAGRPWRLMDAKGKEHAWGGWEGGEDRSFQVMVKSVIVLPVQPDTTDG